MHCIVHGLAYWSGIYLRGILGLTWHMFTHVKTKKSVLPWWSFYFRVVISLSCPIQCCFVALHDYDHNALWLVASQCFAGLPPTPSGILLVLPHSLSKPVVPYESTIPTYIWYLLAIPNEYFRVPSQNLIQKCTFCNRTSSWCGEGKSISFMPKNIWRKF